MITLPARSGEESGWQRRGDPPNRRGIRKLTGGSRFAHKVAPIPDGRALAETRHVGWARIRLPLNQMASNAGAIYCKKVETPRGVRSKNNANTAYRTTTDGSRGCWRSHLYAPWCKVPSSTIP